MKSIVTAMMAAVLLTAGPVRAEEKHTGDYCTKHCTVMELGQEIEALEKKILAEKANLKKLGGSDKLVTLEAERAKTRRHLRHHEREMEDLMRRMDEIEK